MYVPDDKVMQVEFGKGTEAVTRLGASIWWRAWEAIGIKSEVARYIFPTGMTFHARDSSTRYAGYALLKHNQEEQ